MARFRHHDVKRIGRATRRTELTPPFRLDDPNRAPVWSYNGKLAVTSSTISAAVSSQLGSGTATLQNLTATGAISAGVTGVTVYSWVGSTIATATKVFLYSVDGIYVIMGVLCP